MSQDRSESPLSPSIHAPARVLVLGGGGREHAMVRALATANPSPGVELFCAPGNPGIAALATLLPLPSDSQDDSALAAAVVSLAQRYQIDLVLPGGETWLVAGIADALAAVGIPCCGPRRAAAQLEASKRFARELTAPLGVPGPAFVVIDNEADLVRTLATWPGLPVLKADGLAAGKGVFLPTHRDEALAIGRALLQGLLGPAGQTFLLEERLQGPEASLFYACDGVDALPLSHARDHKRLLDGDQGPNTGGMGAVSPCPGLGPAIEAQVQERIVQPTLAALLARGTPFVGFLFVGVMLTNKGPALLEFNARIGDPEAQALLPRLRDGDFLRLVTATAKQRLCDIDLKFLPRHTCGVVCASPGYPGPPQTGQPIQIDEALLQENSAWVVHSGLRQDGDVLRVSGGRVLTVVAQGSTAQEARLRANRAADAVSFAGMQRRSDIGLPSPGTGKHD